MHYARTASITCHAEGGNQMPEQILMEIAAALAAKTAESLYDLVKNKFKGRRQALSALEAANGATDESPQVAELAEQLAIAETEDPQFGEELRAQWAAARRRNSASDSGVANNISGSVRGNVVQARDIKGDITF